MKEELEVFCEYVREIIQIKRNGIKKQIVKTGFEFQRVWKYCQYQSYLLQYTGNRKNTPLTLSSVDQKMCLEHHVYIFEFFWYKYLDNGVYKMRFCYQEHIRKGHKSVKLIFESF